MGYERKRGKLADLNALLRGGGRDRFSLIVGETAVLSNVKYVITLDTDTQLPRDSARQFVGVMAHPLNRARFDTAGKRKGSELVTEGYGILQPRVGISLPGANRSWYARLHGGDPGIDPYTRAVSDVYQDVFRRGLFHRQGDLRRRCVRARARRSLSREPDPEPRSDRGLLRAIGVAERRAVVRGVSVDLSRGHQPPPPLDSRRLAARGLAAAAACPAPASTGCAIRCRCFRSGSSSTTCGAVSSRRRLTLLLLLGWTVLPHAMAVDAGGDRDPAASVGECRSSWICCASRTRCCCGSTSPPPQAWPAAHAAQAALTLAFLPYEATVNLDAIARTAWRMLVTHRRLLEWNPSAADEPDRRRVDDSADRSELATSVKSMWIAPVDRHRLSAILLTRIRSVRRWRRPRRYSSCGSSRPASRGGSAGRSRAAKRG